jgi:hypothetical protein
VSQWTQYRDEATAYIRKELKRLHDEFEHLLNHGVLPGNAGDSHDPPVTPGSSQPTATQQTGTSPTDGAFGAGAADPNKPDPRFPQGTPQVSNPPWDSSKTTMTLADRGKHFLAKAGRTTVYTLINEEPVTLSSAADGEEILGRQATFVITGVPSFVDNGVGGPLHTFEPGTHQISVTPEKQDWTLQIN